MKSLEVGEFMQYRTAQMNGAVKVTNIARETKVNGSFTDETQTETFIGKDGKAYNMIIKTHGPSAGVASRTFYNYYLERVVA